MILFHHSLVGNLINSTFIAGDRFENPDAEFLPVVMEVIGLFGCLEPFKSLWPHLEFFVARTLAESPVAVQGVLRRLPGPPVPPRGAGEVPNIEFKEVPDGLKMLEPPPETLDHAKAVPGGEKADLLLVVVNTPKYGGHGWAELGTAVVTLYNGGGPKFGYLAGHECGHAIAGLAEERPCDDDAPDEPRPNRAKLEEVAASVKAHASPALMRPLGSGRFGLFTASISRS